MQNISRICTCLNTIGEVRTVRHHPAGYPIGLHANQCAQRLDQSPVN